MVFRSAEKQFGGSFCGTLSRFVLEKALKTNANGLAKWLDKFPASIELLQNINVSDEILYRVAKSERRCARGLDGTVSRLVPSFHWEREF